MNTSLRLVVSLLLSSSFLLAQQRPVATYSIVAYDKETGQLGAAVQSHWFCVGCIVIWAEAGVGAVATQSFVDPSYGKLGLDLMRTGKSAPDALQGLVHADPNRQVRQVAMIDSRGFASAFTGCEAIDAAGHQLWGGETSGGWSAISRGISVSIGSTPAADSAPVRPTCGGGEGSFGSRYSVQANLMANDSVWPAMAEAFESAKGDLASRMLAALEAAQSAGGDIRGRQSAALIVVSGKPTGQPWKDRIFDLRVDDHPEPLKELRRLVTINRAYNHMNAGDLAVEHKDHETALREYAAAEKLVENAPDVHPSRLAEMRFWHAVALVNMNRLEEALPLFAKVFAYDENWRKLTPRLVKAGLLPMEVIRRITGVEEIQ